MTHALATLPASALALAALFVGTPATPAAGEGPGGLDVQLRLARCAALRSQYQGQVGRVEAGKDPPAQLVAAARELAEAEVGLSDARVAQVAALERAVGRLREVEDVIARLVAAGRRPPADAAQAAAARREAEARLKARMAEE
jgi:hypothetical protein